MNNVYCVLDNCYEGRLQGDCCSDRYAFPLQGSEHYQFSMFAERQSKLRVIVQEPGGSILTDQATGFGSKHLVGFKTKNAGYHSLYVAPLLIENGPPAFSFSVRVARGWPGRRAYVHFLVDCSQTMDASALQEARDWIGNVLEDWRVDPSLLEDLNLSLWAFGGYACRLSQAVELLDFTLPMFNCIPTEEGDILKAVVQVQAFSDSILRPLVLAPLAPRDVYPPLLVLLSNCRCTRGWSELSNRPARRLPSTLLPVVVLVGREKCDEDNARSITHRVIRPDGGSTDAMRRLLMGWYISPTIWNATRQED